MKINSNESFDVEVVEATEESDGGYVLRVYDFQGLDYNEVELSLIDLYTLAQELQFYLRHRDVG